MFCEKCGAKINEGGKFCPKCGQPVEQPGEALEKHIKKQKGRKSKNIFRVIVFIVAVAALGAGSIFIYDKYKEAKYQDYMAQAKEYMDQMMTENAEESYLKACRLKPERAEPYDGLLNIYWRFDTEKFIETAKEGNKNTDQKEHFDFLLRLGEKENICRAYDEVLGQCAGQSGGVANSDGMIRSFGFCFSKLMDFDTDGTDELLVVYTLTKYKKMEEASYPVDDFIVEVWDCEEGEEKAEKVFSGKPFQDGNGQRIILGQAENDEHIYLNVLDEDSYEVIISILKEEETIPTAINENVTYVLEGNLKNAGDNAQVAWNERYQTEQKLAHMHEAIRNAVKYELDTTGDLDNLPIPYGSYAKETEESQMYICSGMTEEGIPKLSVKYSEDDNKALEFLWDAEKSIYAPSEEAEEKNAVISVEAKGNTLYVYLTADTLDIEAQQELTRETEYDLYAPEDEEDDLVPEGETPQETDEKESQGTDKEGTQDDKTYQLNEEGVAYAVQQFLDEKQLKTLNSSSRYKAADSTEVFRYSEVYWVPIYVDGGSSPSYYALIAGGDFENPGYASIYSAEVYALVEGTGKSSDFEVLEEFDVNQYFK